jgi:hypothetical protein
MLVNLNYKICPNISLSDCVILFFLCADMALSIYKLMSTKYAFTTLINIIECLSRPQNAVVGSAQPTTTCTSRA